MGELIQRHKEHWSNRAFYISTLWGLLLFSLSLVVSVVANNYVILRAENPVTDIVLNNIRVFDVDFIVNYGPALIVALVLTIFFLRPSATPFTIKSIALLIIIRACFISFTHLGQFEPQLAIPTTKLISLLGGGNTGGLFFSGHTGMPFLLALIFWDTKILRWGFVVIAITLGTAMLLGHLHYTIDVVGAFFITPTIFTLAQKFFNKDYQLLLNGLSQASFKVIPKAGLTSKTF